MVTTSIKEAKASIMNLAAGAAAKPQGNKDGDSFQKVFDQQTGNHAGKTDRARKETGKETSHHLKKSGSAKTDSLKDKEYAKKAVDPSEMDEEKLAKLNELAQNAGAELVNRLSELFDISEEELEGLLRDLGMNPQDLLLDASLSDFVMDANNVEDVAELLTNGELYEKLQDLMDAKEELLDQAAGQIGITPKDFLEQMQEQAKNPVEPDAQVDPVAEKPAESEMEQVMNTQGRSETQEKREDKEESHSDGNGGNLVLQQTLQDAAEANLSSVQESEPQAQRVDAERIMRQIMDHMKVQLKPDISSLEMQLHPASLGNLQVHLTSKGGMVTAQFFAQNETVKAALETQMIQLQESFEEQGIKVDAIEVAVQTNGFERNLEEQGRGRQEQQAPKAKAVRRLRIDEPLTPEQLDELTKDDRLAAEMMQAGGGSVDFTA